MKLNTGKLLFALFIVLRKVLYFGLFVLGGLFPKNKVVILCYHSISNDQWRFGVDRASLERQMKMMLEHYNPVTLDEISKFVRGEMYFNTPVFAVTFDDGYADILQSRELFSKLHIRPTVFLIADEQSINYGELGSHLDFLTSEQIRTLIDSGWSVGSHSMSHSDFYSDETNFVEKEVVESKQLLEKKLGISIDYFAYPKGRYTTKIANKVRDVYSAAFSMNDDFIVSGIDLATIPRVGIDRTHSDIEFQATLSTPAVLMRSIVKRIDKWVTLLERKYAKTA